MIATRKKLMDRAQDAKSESKYIDFKGQFNAASTEAWCGIIKDIIAMSNSGGGTIIFGIENDGTANSHVDHAALLAYDTADITNRISKYTGYQFSEIEIVELRRDGKTHACFLVSAADVPIVFTKPGEYETTDKKKVAFTQGTVYFRHGSKSEPGNRDDLLKWREREIERARKTWMTGIRKVVETAPRDSVTVFPSSVLAPNYGSIVKAAMSTDPSAVRIVPGNAEEIWPHRQGDVIREVNKRIESGRKINSFDITCVKAAYDILKKRPDFAYKPHKKSSPQYSGAFIEWLVEQYEKNKNFFLKAREEYKAPTNIARAV